MMKTTCLTHVTVLKQMFLIGSLFSSKCRFRDPGSVSCFTPTSSTHGFKITMGGERMTEWEDFSGSDLKVTHIFSNYIS